MGHGYSCRFVVLVQPLERVWVKELRSRGWCGRIWLILGALAWEQTQFRPWQHRILTVHAWGAGVKTAVGTCV